jgi:hypothetical protein
VEGSGDQVSLLPGIIQDAVTRLPFLLQAQSLVYLSLTAFTIDIIRLHDKWVIDHVPKEKLLVMKIQEGWEPLCKFLGKPIPEEPFPKGNQMSEVPKAAAIIFARLTFRWFVLLATVGGIPYAAYRLYHQNA